jgi:hypothetical protein
MIQKIAKLVFHPKKYFILAVKDDATANVLSLSEYIFLYAGPNGY